MEFSLATPHDLPTVLEVELDAFEGDEEIRKLVTDLHRDASAQPSLSILASEGEETLAHVLLTRARLATAPSMSCMILAPLAVRMKAQQRGAGQAVTAHALACARELGVELVFVLGHIEYYPRCGFAPAEGGSSAPMP